LVQVTGVQTCALPICLREQGADCVEDVVERSILVSEWCPWCEQPCVDGRYPREITLIFAPFFSCS
jgi:hypothetical protein